MDYLHPKLDDAAIARMTSLALAHVGDAVYEVLVRSFLACGGTQTAKNLHSRTVELVRASAQAEAVQRILPLLDEEEQDVFRHGRNAKPKNRAQIRVRRGICARDRPGGAVRLAVPQAAVRAHQRACSA